MKLLIQFSKILTLIKLPNLLKVIFEFVPHSLYGIFAVAGMLFILLGLLYNQAIKLVALLLNLEKSSLFNDGDAFVFWCDISFYCDCNTFL